MITLFTPCTLHVSKWYRDRNFSATFIAVSQKISYAHMVKFYSTKSNSCETRLNERLGETGVRGVPRK